MSVTTVPTDHAVLHGISWETYERLLTELEDRKLRLTYDRGTLEIISPSPRHEDVRHRLRRLIEALADALAIQIKGGGSTTWRRLDLERGLEPDECYWVANESSMRGRIDIDLRVDPPPDLVVEVDVHSSSVNRMGIYAALGVPEVWRWKSGTVTVHARRDDRGYDPVERSLAFPMLPMSEFTTWLEDDWIDGETAYVGRFRDWARRTLPS